MDAKQQQDIDAEVKKAVELVEKTVPVAVKHLRRMLLLIGLSLWLFNLLVVGLSLYFYKGW